MPQTIAESYNTKKYVFNWIFESDQMLMFLVFIWSQIPNIQNLWEQ